MHDIRPDVEKNRLTLTLKGVFNKREGEQCVTDIVSAVNQLKRGFDVITDISEFEGSDKKSDEFLQGVLKFLVIRGVKRVIRVVGGSREALVKFARVTIQLDKYPVQYVPTMGDAEKILNS